MELREKFDLHIGEYVRSRIDESELTQTEVARQLSIEKSSLSSRFLRPHYGTVYDLMETSLVLKENLFSLVITALDKENLPHDQYYTSEEFKQLKDELRECKSTIEKLEAKEEKLFKVIDSLTVK